MADRSDFDLVQFVDYLPVQSSFLCTCVDKKSLPVFACIPMDVFALAYVCVCVFSPAPLGRGGSSKVRQGEAVGRGIRTSSPRKQKPELQPLKTMRRTCETLAHGG